MDHLRDIQERTLELLRLHKQGLLTDSEIEKALELISIESEVRFQKSLTKLLCSLA